MWPLLLVLLQLSSSCVAVMQVPTSDRVTYEKFGDLNLGILLGIHPYSQRGRCQTDAVSTGLVQILETTVYAIHQVNERTDILPNVTLGFVAADDCQSEVISLAKAVQFVVQSKHAYGNESDTCEADAYRGDEVNRDVIGVIGPSSSGQALMTSGFLGLFEIPSLSMTATNDELSDDTRFGYFLRTVMPDSYQSKALVDVMMHFGWTYFSLIYSESSYTEGAAKHVEKFAKMKGLCMAFSSRIGYEANEEEFATLARLLSVHSKAKVVVNLLYSFHQRSLYAAMDKLGLSGRFLWLSEDLMVSNWASFNETDWAIFTGFHGALHPGFKKYYNALPCWNSSNPWLPEVCEKQFSCSRDVADDNSSASCSRYGAIGDEGTVPTPAFYSNWVDGVLIYAHALHDLISAHCPEVFMGDKRRLRECVSGQRLLNFMKNVSFEGLIGHIQFHPDGYVQTGYTLEQVQPNLRGRKSIRTGEWGRNGNGLSLYTANLQWPSAWLVDENTGNPLPYPESVCSKPCLPREYTHQLELPCCWECRRCRDNEHITANDSACAICPPFTWPDDLRGRACLALTPTYLRHSDLAGIILLCLAAVGALSMLVVTVIVIRNFHRKLIKASSRELSLIILGGVLLAALVTFTFITPPSLVTCVVRQAGFHFAVTVIYAPLLVKTSRVYRIFAASLKGNTRPRFTSSKTQITFATYGIILQIIILLGVQLKSPSVTKLRMPIPSVPEVELVCERPLWGFLLPLCYNMAIITACAVLGFLTRKLPENFNESWFIFISVTTTLFLWAVFIPAYFTAFYAIHQTALLAVSLLLNLFITLGCQFGPKLYALYYVKEEAIKFATTTTVSMIHPVS